jgi:hypothetical protein
MNFKLRSSGTDIICIILECKFYLYRFLLCLHFICSQSMSMSRSQDFVQTMCTTAVVLINDMSLNWRVSLVCKSEVEPLHGASTFVSYLFYILNQV